MNTKEELVGLLKEGTVNVKFKKKDQSIRKMLCTLSSDYLPKTDPSEIKEKKTKKVNEDTLPVWDLEKEAWRSFRLDSIVEYQKAV
jgi:hypothetical protein